MKFFVVIEQAADGSYSGTIPALPGLLLMGETPDDLLANAPAAIRFHLQDLGFTKFADSENFSTAIIDVDI